MINSSGITPQNSIHIREGARRYGWGDSEEEIGDDCDAGVDDGVGDDETDNESDDAGAM